MAATRQTLRCRGLRGFLKAQTSLEKNTSDYFCSNNTLNSKAFNTFLGPTSPCVPFTVNIGDCYMTILRTRYSTVKSGFTIAICCIAVTCYWDFAPTTEIIYNFICFLRLPDLRPFDEIIISIALSTIVLPEVTSD